MALLETPGARRARASSRSTWRPDCSGALLDLVGEFGLALPAQCPDVGRQHLKRRLEAVRQVGGTRPGSCEGFPCASRRRLIFIGKRLHLARRRHVKPRRSLRDHVSNGDPQVFQRRKANGDLDEECRHQTGGEHDERRREIADNIVHRHFDAAVVFPPQWRERTGRRHR